jgi:hypothetical protein
MARPKRPHQSRKSAPQSAAPGAADSYRQHLYESLEHYSRTGEWESWLHNALEIGDPQFWPQIREFYQEKPSERWMILFHLRIYWTEYEHMVAPLFREALRDPEECDEAIRALEVFPSLREDVLTALHNRECFGRVLDSLPQAVACLQQYPDQAVPLLQGILRDPVYSRDFNSCWLAIQASSLFPELTDAVVRCFKEPEVVATVEPAVLVASLAALFSVVDAVVIDAGFEDRGNDPAIWSGVEAELRRRYSLDLNRLIAAAYD